ncbi:MAG TPA: ADYC domain-containing protein [Myxococcaceae bacterium]|nr:ADYC domain-containing protein [Myxococcaceae bacterium]
MAVDITLHGCVQVPNTRYAECRRARVGLKASAPESLFCGRWIKRKKDGEYFTLFALDAVHDGKGRFIFNGGKLHDFTLACAAEDLASVTEQEWNALGAVGKCLLWPFPPPPPPSAPNCLPTRPRGFVPLAASTDAFDSCVRAVRADYCGDGVSHTKDTTLIDLYDNPGTSVHEALPAFLLEANWNPTGALCILHARYVSLPPTCQLRFQTPVSFFPVSDNPDGGVKIGLRGSDYMCAGNQVLPPGCDKEGHCIAVTQAQRLLRQGTLMDDSLLQP